MAEAVAPTLKDARAAGRALTGAGVREVLAYGSVVVGGGDPSSPRAQLRAAQAAAADPPRVRPARLRGRAGR